MRAQPWKRYVAALMAFGLAVANCGVALARSSLAEQEIASGQLVCPFPIKVPIEEAFHLVSPTDNNGHPDAETFRHWLLEKVSSQAA